MVFSASSDEGLLTSNSEEDEPQFPLNNKFTMQTDTLGRFVLEPITLDNGGLQVNIIDRKYRQNYTHSLNGIVKYLILIDKFTKNWYAFSVIDNVVTNLSKTSEKGRDLNNFLKYLTPLDNFIKVITLRNYKASNPLTSSKTITYRSPLKRRLRTTVRYLPQRLSRFFREKVARPIHTAYSNHKTQRIMRRAKNVAATKSLLPKKTAKSAWRFWQKKS